MVGIKGKSGGFRPGAGRKVARFTLKRDTQYGIGIEMSDGFLPPTWATVVEVDRKLIVLQLDNGDRLTIYR